MTDAEKLKTLLHEDDLLDLDLQMRRQLPTEEHAELVDDAKQIDSYAWQCRDRSCLVVIFRDDGTTESLVFPPSE